MLDFSRCPLPPFKHQREDVASMIAHPWFFITSEMRTGKSLIVVVAAQFLFEADKIDKVVVVAPAPVRDVWADQTLGEIAKHSFIPTKVTEFHARVKMWQRGEGRKLEWYVTNFEFLRSRNRLIQLLPACGQRTLLVVDESSFVRNWKSLQTQALFTVRWLCGRVVLLNGTPIFHSPLDLFSQGNLLHPSILGCPFVTHFKARYAVEVPTLGSGGQKLPTHPKRIRQPDGSMKVVPQFVHHIEGWTNLEDLQRRFAPVTVRRLQADCLDLPPKLDPVTLTAQLTPATWKMYKQMRDELVVWLKNDKVAIGATAAIKVLRLAQITGGFLGGIEDTGVKIDDGIGEEPEWLLELDGPKYDEARGNSTGPRDEGAARASVGEVADEPEVRGLLGDTAGDLSSDEGPGEARGKAGEPIEVGREKLDVLLWFIEHRLEADPNLHLVAWFKYRAEVFRAVEEVARKYPQFEVGMIMGQKTAERRRALSLLKPETTPAGPVFVAGIEGTGSFGLDMTASHTCVTMSSGYSPGRTAQTLDRVYGPGQKHPIAYFTVLATGPQGEKTIDHVIEAARREGQNIATWVASDWIKVLTTE